MPASDTVGAVLAGGAGRRMGGGGKATVELAGRPLAAYPTAALRAVCERVVIVCKPGTPLPALPGVDVWEEPEEPRHPLTGIVHALRRARTAVLVCAVDMPFVTAEACFALLAAGRAAGAERGGMGPPGVVARSGGRLQPVFGLYRLQALATLEASAPDASLTATVAALAPLAVDLPESLTRSVNTPADLAAAERRLARERRGEEPAP